MPNCARGTTSQRIKSMDTLSNGAMVCMVCGYVGLPTLVHASGVPHARVHCRGCGRWLKWAPEPREASMVMDGVNYLLVSGTIERNPGVRFREDGTCVC